MRETEEKTPVTENAGAAGKGSPARGALRFCLKLARLALTAALFLVLLVLALVWWVVFTESGSEVVWNRVKAAVPMVGGEFAAGSFGRGFTLRNFSLKIEDTIHVDAGEVSVKYDVWGLLSRRLDVEYLRTKDVLLVLGNRPEETPLIGDFLKDRLYENHSFGLNEKGDMVRTRDSSARVDPTLAVIPAPLVNPAAEEPEEVPDDGEPFVLDFPIRLNAKSIEVDGFWMLSDIIDVAVEKCRASAVWEGPRLNVAYLGIEYSDTLLHGADREALAALRDSGKKVEFADLLARHPEWRAAAGEAAAENAENAEGAAESAGAGTAAAAEAGAAAPAGGATAAAPAGTEPEAGAGEEAGPEPEPLRDPYDRKEIAAKIEPLVTVILPFDLYAENVEIKNSRYRMDGFDTGIFDGGFKMSYVGTEIFVNRLRINHELGHAALLNSSIALDAYYPITAHLFAFSRNEDWFGLLNTHKLKATVTGDLADLNAEVIVRGATDADVTARSDVLAPGLPFSADVGVKHARWPVTGEKPDYAVGELNLKASGSLGGIDAELSAKGVEAMDFPVLDVEADVGTDFAQAWIRKFEVNSDNGDRVAAAGDAVWQGQYSYDGSLDVKITDLARYNPDMDGALDFGMTAYLHYQSLTDWYAKVTRLEADGRYAGYPLSLSSGNLELNSAYRGVIEGIKASAGDRNTVDISGTLGDELSVNAEFTLQNLGTLMPDWSGQVDGSFKVRGTIDAPKFDFEWFISELAAMDLHISNADVAGKAWFKGMYLDDAFLKVYLEEMHQGSDEYLSDFNLLFSGGEGEHNLTLDSGTIAGPVSLALRGGLAKARDVYTGTLHKLTAGLKGADVKLAKRVDFTVALKPELAVTAGGHSWDVNEIAINVSDAFYSAKKARVNLDIPELNVMKFKEFLPDTLYVKNPVAIAANFEMEGSRPRAQVELKEAANTVYYNRQRLKIDRLGLKANLDGDDLTSDLVVDLGKHGNLRSQLGISALSSARTLGGTLDVDGLDLGLAEKFSEDITAAGGKFVCHGRYAGNLAAPEFYGQLRIDDMSLSPAVNVGEITKFNTVMEVAGSRADIDSSFLFNGKKGTVTGDVAWAPAVSASVKISTEEIPVRLLGYGDGIFQADIEGRFTDTMSRVSGKVRVPQARIVVKDLPESSVSVSSDVVELVSDENGNLVEPGGYDSPVVLRVDIDLGPDINVRALGLRTDMHGALKLTQRPHRPLSLVGKIELEDGTFHAYGQNLLIEQGYVAFTGDPANPALSIRAIRNPHAMENQNITAGIMVTGSANSPNVQIFSRPAMSQSEALSYLLRGKGLDQTSGGSDMATQVLLSAGLMQTSGMISNIGEAVGLEDMALDSRGEGDETAVEVSAYVLPKVQVAYGYGIYNAVSEFRIRYEMFPRFYLEAVNSIEQAVDAVYKFDFDF